MCHLGDRSAKKRLRGKNAHHLLDNDTLQAYPYRSRRMFRSQRAELSTNFGHMSLEVQVPFYLGVNLEFWVFFLFTWKWSLLNDPAKCLFNSVQLLGVASTPFAFTKQLFFGNVMGLQLCKFAICTTSEVQFASHFCLISPLFKWKSL